MEMAHVETWHEPVCDGIRKIELMGSNNEGFTPDTEELAFDGVLHLAAIERRCENLVERSFQKRAMFKTAHGRVFRSVGDPEIMEARTPLRSSQKCADRAAALHVLDPEFPDPCVAIAQRITGFGFRVCKAGGIEIQFHLLLIRPLQPAPEMVGQNCIAIDDRAAEVAVDGVQVEAVPAGKERESLVEVCAEFIDGPRPTWKAPRCLDSP
jgi:hypothetical protein